MNNPAVTSAQNASEWVNSRCGRDTPIAINTNNPTAPGRHKGPSTGARSPISPYGAAQSITASATTAKKTPPAHLEISFEPLLLSRSVSGSSPPTAPAAAVATNEAITVGRKSSTEAAMPTTTCVFPCTVPPPPPNRSSSLPARERGQALPQKERRYERYSMFRPGFCGNLRRGQERQ